MAKFEIYKDSNSRSLSLIIKMFFWRYFTLAICPILTEFDFYFSSGKYSFLSQSEEVNSRSNLGIYDDFTAVWYQASGSSIVMTSFMRIIILVLQGGFKFLRQKLKIWHDQK